MPEDIIDYLAGQWNGSLLSTADKQSGIEAFGFLIQAYMQPHRFYHTLGHIKALLKQAEELPLNDKAAVRMAIFYHDIIYDTDPDVLSSIQSGRTLSNEERSARLAIRDMTDMGFDAATIKKTARMIRLTETHECDHEDDIDTKFFLDMDMSIIGAPAEQYAKYVSQIECEYARVPKEAYMKARTNFINSALKSAKLFCTERYNRQYADQSYKNLQYELSVHNAEGGIAMMRADCRPTPKASP